MSTLGERAEKAEQRVRELEGVIGSASELLFADAVRETVYARKYTFQREAHKAEANQAVFGLYYLSDGAERAVLAEIRARVETAADEQMAAAGAGDTAPS